MKEALQKIKFHYLYKPFHFPERNRLKTFILKKLKKEGKEVGAINYVFCDDEYLVQINQQYLKHNTLTDIVTFELSTKNQPLISDIYISIERVKENAGKYGVPYLEELRRVVFHGALHLAGYKDKKKADIKLMRQKEEEYLRDYNVSRGTVSR